MRNIRKNQGAMMPECETFSKIKGPEPKDDRGTRRKRGENDRGDDHGDEDFLDL